MRLCAALLFNTSGAMEQSKIMDILAIITVSLKQLGSIEVKPILYWLLRDLHVDLTELDSDAYIQTMLKKEWKDVLHLAFDQVKCLGLPNLLNTNFIEEISLNEVRKSH